MANMYFCFQMIFTKIIRLTRQIIFYIAENKHVKISNLIYSPFSIFHSRNFVKNMKPQGVYIIKHKKMKF